MAATSSSTGRTAWNKAGLFHLLVVYIIWGSTYLGIRLAVREGAGFTPFMMGAFRATAAGLVLLVIGMLTGQRVRLQKKELLVLAAMGLFFWVGGNGLVMVAEQTADSGLAAMIVAGSPIFAALIQAVWDRRLPSALLVISLAAGMVGIVLLSMPVLQSGVKADLLSVLMLVIASVSWAAGTVVQSKMRPDVSAGVSSGYQMFFGGIGFTILALVTREPLPRPELSAWLAFFYLLIFGSLVGFTSYVSALRLLPTAVVTTHSYVNPVIAILLGWMILREPVTAWTVAGAALILVSVYGVFRDHNRAWQAQAELPLSGSEAGQD